MKNYKRGNSALIIFLIVLVLAAGATWYLSQNSATPSVAPPPATTAPPGFIPPTTPPPTTTDETATLTTARVSDEQIKTVVENSWQAGLKYIPGSSASVSKIFRGDLNGDNFSDAVVTVWSCGASCGQSNRLIVDHNGAPEILHDIHHLTLYIPNPDGAGASSPGIEVISINNGVITVSEILDDKSIGTKKYKLEGGAVVEIK